MTGQHQQPKTQKTIIMPDLSRTIPKRRNCPRPDPAESVMYSDLPVFRSPANWLPDYTHQAEDHPECCLPVVDQLSPADYQQCPPKAPYPKNQRLIDMCACEIAKWVFDTYCALVKHHLGIYNKYRRQYNDSILKGLSPSPKTLAYYRKACRLAWEQIVRRDLPLISGFDWLYDQPVLPIFEIELEIEVGSDLAQDINNQVVQNVIIRGTVEVRQRNGDEVPGAAMVQNVGGQQEWSSSSSSSSSSEFDPG